MTDSEAKLSNLKNIVSTMRTSCDLLEHRIDKLQSFASLFGHNELVVPVIEHETRKSLDELDQHCQWLRDWLE